jgi:hypothetical protein
MSGYARGKKDVDIPVSGRTISSPGFVVHGDGEGLDQADHIRVRLVILLPVGTCLDPGCRKVGLWWHVHW